MGTDEVRTRIKDIIAKVTKIDPQTIPDTASFREDLGLDSLSVLETLVEVQFRFHLPDVSDDEFASIRTIEDTVRFIQDKRCLEPV